MGRLKAGTRIERYIVEGTLGEGGMARVYRVRHETLGIEKALKVLTLTAKGVRKRLVREGTMQANLMHDNIVKVEDVLTVKNAPALLMELVDGPDMEGWLQRYQPTLDEALVLFRGILAGVGYAHSNGLIHRDLKTANVLLALGGGRMTPKVTDFGLAKGVRREDFVDSAGKTRAGSTMGTPQFMSPEQIRDASHVDRRADMWSLGCILYRLTCGVAPFEGDDIIELFNLIAAGDYIPPRSLKREMPERIAHAIEALLEPDPARRLADCSELMAYLDGEVTFLGDRTLVPIGELRDSPAPKTDMPRWLDADLEPSRIARELVDETLASLPKLRRTRQKTWSTPEPAERTSNVVSQTLAPPPSPSEQHTQVPLAPPPPIRSSTRRMVGSAAVVFTMLAGTFLVVVVGGFVGWQLGMFSPSTTVVSGTDGVVPPTAPRPVVPEPTPRPTPSVRPTPSERPSPTPTPVVPDPEPVVPVAVPVPTPEPAGGGMATVEFTGARSLFLIPEGGGPAHRPGEVPAGRYRIMAVFEGAATEVQAGAVTLSDGEQVTLRCAPAFQQCKP